MYEITIKGNTPAELFANLAQMAAANMNAAMIGPLFLLGLLHKQGL